MSHSQFSNKKEENHKVWMIVYPDSFMVLFFFIRTSFIKTSCLSCNYSLVTCCPSV